MQRKGIGSLALLAATLIIVLSSLERASAQSNGSSNMAFSPYTMYGLGDMIPLGTASTMSMGGIGVGMRSPLEINYTNPASLSALLRRSALFSFGARGTNHYSKTANSKTSYSNFDISDLGFAIPLYRGVGLSFALNPVTAVGYGTTMIDTTRNVTQNIGRARYEYQGDGGISQITMGLGVMIVRGFSVGATLNYNFGNINRDYSAQIFPFLGQTTQYRTLLSNSSIHVSKLMMSFGAQYSHRVGRYSDITIGATYQPKSNINAPRKDEKFVVLNYTVDTLSMEDYDFQIKYPEKIALGLYYRNPKFTIGADWAQQDWNGAFNLQTSEKITLQKQTDYKFGLSFTPNRSSLSSFLKRWTYKAGFHYSESYLKKNNEPMRDMGFSAGLDIPLRKGRYESKMTFGVDFGKRGSDKQGQVKDNYFKVYAGLTLFSLDFDYWFHRQKFQ